MKKTLFLFFIFCINFVYADILVSIKPLALVANEITGENTDYLIKNSDIHTYSLTISDLQKIHDADLFYFIGDAAETFLKKGIQSRQKPSVELMGLHGMLILSGEHEHEHEHEHHDHSHDHSVDSHIWLETKNMKVFAQKLAEDLTVLNPNKADFYQNNLNTFIKKLDDLGGKINNIYSKTPKNFSFFVNHDSYQYLDSKYNLKPSYVFNVYHGSGLSVKKLALLGEKLSDKACIFIDYNANKDMLGKLIDIKSHSSDGIVFDGVKGKMVVRDQLATNDEDYFTFMENIANKINLCL